jgi:hypothetical protein
MNQESLKELLYNVRVTNTGLRDITIETVVWRFGFLSKKHFVQVPNWHPHSTPIPTKLAPSAIAHYYFPGDWADKSADMLKLLGHGIVRWLNESTLKVGVSLSTGETIYTRADKDVVLRLRSALKYTE